MVPERHTAPGSGWSDMHDDMHVVQNACLTAENQYGDDALPAGSACSSANAAHIFRRIAWEVEQDDMLHMRGVDAAGGAVRADENHALVVIRSSEKILQGRRARTLSCCSIRSASADENSAVAVSRLVSG